MGATSHSGTKLPASRNACSDAKAEARGVTWYLVFRRPVDDDVASAI